MLEYILRLFGVVPVAVMLYLQRATVQRITKAFSKKPKRMPTPTNNSSDTLMGTPKSGGVAFVRFSTRNVRHVN